MNLRARLVPFLLACLAAGLLAPGCARHVPVKGQVTYKGKPVPGSEEAPLRVSFCPLVGDEDQFERVQEAVVNQEDGTFELRRGLPAGRYRIAVRREDASLTDLFEDRFGEGQSPIVRELNDGKEIVIDLASPAG